MVDRLIVIDQGRILADGPKDTVMEALRQVALWGLRHANQKRKPFTDWVFSHWQEGAHHKDWVTEAEMGAHQSTPLRAQKLLYAIALVFILLLWAAFAPLDEIARGDGKLFPRKTANIAIFRWRFNSRYFGARRPNRKRGRYFD